jgi:hypothetical protein
MVSDMQTDSSMWAAIEGVMRNDPHPRSKFQKTLRAKLIATDAKGQQTEVRLIVRQASEAYREMLTIRNGELVRVIGPMRIGAERTQHSRIERLMKCLKFWSTK